MPSLRPDVQGIALGGGGEVHYKGAVTTAEPPASTAGSLGKPAIEVLRYWQALLRYEEALSATPRARRPAEGTQSAPNLVTPVAGQDYMKLPFAGAARLLVEQRGPLRQPLDAERLAFFEHWLAGKYRAPEDDTRTAHLALFPVVHSPRDELFGLLRFPVQIGWHGEGKRFVVPTPAERRAQPPREAPGEIEIREAEPSDEKRPPFFVDLRLLRDTLRVDADALDAFFALSRREPPPSGPELLAAVSQLLAASIAADEAEAAGAAPSNTPSNTTERDAAGKPARTPPAAPAGSGVQTVAADPAASLEHLQSLLVRRLQQLGSRHRAFPVALIVASDRSRTTWHVQRDLEQAEASIEADGLAAGTPLGAYLGGRAAAGRSRVCLGRWPRAPLTTSQRVALEHALGSPFAAVQGPPGTGKTTVILNLVAHQLIEKCRALVQSNVMSEDFVLVTSTNNRAVDNVVEALSVEPFSELPLCLRLGNRGLLEKVTARTLERLLAWLTRQPEQMDPAELTTAKQKFSEALARAEARTRALGEGYDESAEQASLLAQKDELTALASDESRHDAALRVRERLGQLPGASPESAAAPTLPAASDGPWRRSPKAAALAVRGLIRAFDKLSEQCDEGGAGALPRVTAMLGRLRTRELVRFEEAIGISLALGELRRAPSNLEDCEDALAALALPLTALASALEQLGETDQAVDKLRTLAARHRAPNPSQEGADDAAPDTNTDTDTAAPLDADPEAEAAFELLFQRATELRTAWLRQHRAAISKSLELAIAQSKNLRSLRSLLDSPKAAGSWLRQLFPSLGCTLLSLGNALKADAPSCRRVVIDEAGQCPSAYAVSALLRAHSALLIGDVHQLEPVVGLSRDDERRIVRGLNLKLSPDRLAPYRMFDESENSAQSVADAAVPLRHTLRDHFRCQPAIIALSEAWCRYGMLVRTPPRSRALEAPRLSAAALFQACDGQQERFAGSWINPIEIEQVLAWLGYLLEHGIAPADIGVITPFRSQSEALTRRLGQARIPLARPFEDHEADQNLDLFGGRDTRGSGVAVGTVHRFQGGERSIVIFSSTLSRAASLRFVDDRVNLLNVAVSRAQEHLLVIGHEPTLRAGQHTRRLVSGAVRTTGF